VSHTAFVKVGCSVEGNWQWGQEVVFHMLLLHPHQVNILHYAQSACMQPLMKSASIHSSHTFASLKVRYPQSQVHKRACFSEEQLYAVQGVLHLHSHKPPILHRDLKSPNMLVERHWRVKVTDFNLSRMVQPSSTGSSVNSLLANNPRWLAPEVCIMLCRTLDSCPFFWASLLFSSGLLACNL